MLPTKENVCNVLINNKVERNKRKSYEMRRNDINFVQIIPVYNATI